MGEHRKQFAFKGKREHIANVNITKQHTQVNTWFKRSCNYTRHRQIKVAFNLNIESTDKVRSVVNNVGRALVKQKVLKLGSTNIDTINNSDVYDTYKDLYLSEKEREERLIQGIQPANGLKARLGAKKADDTALTLTTQENGIKKTLDKRFSIPLDFDFFK